MCLGRPYLGRHLYAGSPGLQCSRSIGRSIQGLWECLLVPVPVTVQTMTLVGGRGGPWLSPRGLMPRLLGRESLVACAPGPTCGCPGVVSALGVAYLVSWEHCSKQMCAWWCAWKRHAVLGSGSWFLPSSDDSCVWVVTVRRVLCLLHAEHMHASLALFRLLDRSCCSDGWNTGALGLKSSGPGIGVGKGLFLWYGVGDPPALVNSRPMCFNSQFFFPIEPCYEARRVPNFPCDLCIG